MADVQAAYGVHNVDEPNTNAPPLPLLPLSAGSDVQARGNGTSTGAPTGPENDQPPLTKASPPNLALLVAVPIVSACVIVAATLAVLSWRATADPRADLGAGAEQRKCRKVGGSIGPITAGSTHSIGTDLLTNSSCVWAEAGAHAAVLTLQGTQGSSAGDAAVSMDMPLWSTAKGAVKPRAERCSLALSTSTGAGTPSSRGGDCSFANDAWLQLLSDEGNMVRAGLSLHQHGVQAASPA